MPIITLVKPQRNNKRINIYLDGKFAFGIDLENFVKEKLKIGNELSDEDVAEIVKKAEYAKTLDKLLRFATLRPRSRKEVFDWFLRRKVHDSLHKKLILKLEKLDLLNDALFAKWWVEQRISYKTKSLKEIVYELKAKGINTNTIEDVLYESGYDEDKTIKKIIENKKYKWERFDQKTYKQKAGEYLLRKGFSWGAIEKTLKKR